METRDDVKKLEERMIRMEDKIDKLNEKYGHFLRLYVVYTLVLIIVLWAGTSYGQVRAIHFNAEWNEANNVEWFNKLSDVEKAMDIVKNDYQEKYKTAIVPTIVIFKDGEEVARFQADLSFKMVAIRKKSKQE